MADETKLEVKAHVNKIIDKTKQDLKVSRQKIESEYQDYYLLDAYGKKSMGIGSGAFGYDAMQDDDINGKYAIMREYTSVYNSKLNPDFFRDTTAKYKLVKITPGYWRVEKHFDNGKLEKTPIFKGHATVSKYTNISRKIETRNDTYFEFESDSIAGGRIYFNEVVKAQRRKKDWVAEIPQDAKHTIDSLNQEISRKKQLIELVKQKSKEADSIAKNIVKKKFETNER